MAAASSRERRVRVLAIASGGGHWVQLLRIVPALEGADIAFATVRADYRQDRPGDRLYVIEDATRWDRWPLIRCAFQILWILLRERPDVIITTGAAPGGLAVLLGRLFRIRSLWLDSIANVEAFSMTGRYASRFATLSLTQWSHLAEPNGPEHAGAVL